MISELNLSMLFTLWKEEVGNPTFFILSFVSRANVYFWDSKSACGPKISSITWSVSAEYDITGLYRSREHGSIQWQVEFRTIPGREI